jgi:hypothetical protein
MRGRIAIIAFVGLLALLEAPLLPAQGRSGMSHGNGGSSHGNGFRNNQPTTFTGFPTAGINPMIVPLANQRPPIIAHGHGFRNSPVVAVPLYYAGYNGYISDSDAAYSPGNSNGYAYGPNAPVVVTGSDPGAVGGVTYRQQTLERRLDDQAVEMDRLKRERSTPAATGESEDLQPATILVFKDKRSPELVHNYAIVGSNLFVMGKSHRKIALSDLDLVATSRANEDAGLDFKMPGTPPPQLKSGLGISR